MMSSAKAIYRKVHPFIHEPAFTGGHTETPTDAMALSSFESQANLNGQILKSYQSMGDDQLDQLDGWIDALTKESLQFIADRRGVKVQKLEEEALFTKATASMVERLFNLLSVFAFEFNRALGLSDLHVSNTAPSYVTEVLRYNKMREVTETATYFRARFSTRYFSLVIRGHGDVIEFILLPVEKALGLCKAEKAYNPVNILTSKLEEDTVVWSLGSDQAITPPETLQLCQQLFNLLIEKTRESVALDSTT